VVLEWVRKISPGGNVEKDPLNHPDPGTASNGLAKEQDNLPSSRKVFLYFLLLGFINIGGPVAQISMMYNLMVEKERWLSAERFTKIMAFCHLLPGPEALQLAIYVGYLKKRLLGAMIAGVTFIFPGAVAMIGLSYLYVTYGYLPQIKDLLWILKPAVLGIIAAGIIKLGRAAIKNLFLALLVLTAVLAMVFARLDFLIVLFGSGLIYLVYREFKLKIGSGWHLLLFTQVALAGTEVASSAGKSDVWLPMAWLFLKTGLFSFGGAYASLIFVEHGAVEGYHWLTDSQLLDGVAMSVATPGPFMLFTTFVGYLTKGVGGAVAATVLVFLPSFVFVILGTYYIEKVRNERHIQTFLAGASAAVVGVIIDVSWKLIPDSLVDIPSYLIAAAAFLAIVWRKIDIAKVAIAAIAAGGIYAGIRPFI
jgi:chromate transporter